MLVFTDIKVVNKQCYEQHTVLDKISNLLRKIYGPVKTNLQKGGEEVTKLQPIYTSELQVLYREPDLAKLLCRELDMAKLLYEEPETPVLKNSYNLSLVCATS